MRRDPHLGSAKIQVSFRRATSSKACCGGGNRFFGQFAFVFGLVDGFDFDFTRGRLEIRRGRFFDGWFLAFGQRLRRQRRVEYDKGLLYRGWCFCNRDGFRGPCRSRILLPTSGGTTQANSGKNRRCHRE